jgi:hypothetical protein
MIDLLAALRDCYTPTGRNLVDAGLIRSSTLSPDTEAPGYNIPGVPLRHIAHITLYAPTADEAATAQLAAQIENRLLGLQAISRVEITLLPPLFPIL